MNIIFANKQRKYPITTELKKFLNTIAIETFKEEGIQNPVEISLLLVNNRFIKELNKEFRNIDKSTDVLSFPMHEKKELKKLVKNAQKEVLLGDIVVSLEKTEEQAKDFGHSFDRELGYLFVHGLLHLIGYDHIKSRDKKKMRKKEEIVLGKLNIYR